MIEKKYANEDLEIELTSFIDNKQNVWFKGKDNAKILGYSNTKKAILARVSTSHKMLHLMRPQCWGNNSLPQPSGVGVDYTSGPKMGPVSTKCWGPKMGPATQSQQNDTRGKWCTFIDEAGFYELVFSSKLPTAKKFRDWVFTTVLPSIRRYGQYKLFDNP